MKKQRLSKFKILTNGFRDLISDIKGSEKSLYEKMIDLLRSFSKDGERISKESDNRKANKKRLGRIKGLIAESIIESKYENKVNNFNKNFSKVERLSKILIANDAKLEKVDLDVSQERKLFIKQIVDGMLTDDAISAILETPLTQLLFRHATSGIKYQDAEKEIRDFLLGRGTGGGKLANRARFYAFESLQRFNGTIHQKACKKYNLNVYRILNPLITTSEQICIDMIERKNKAGSFSVGDRFFLTEDIPEIIKEIERQGHHKNTQLTPENYFIYRNHIGCIHDFSCTRRSNKWIEEKKKERAIRNG